MPEQSPTPSDYDRYISDLFAPQDDALSACLAAMHEGGLPEINVSASEGKLLYLLASIMGARRILEVGTLGGYSTTWLARALPADGRLLSLEIDPHHADVARGNIARAGLAGRVEIRVGTAAESLRTLPSTGEAPFDIAFIDADKGGYVEYLALCYPLVRSGGLILGDNALSHNALDPASGSPIARYNSAVAAHPGLESVIVPTLRHSIDGLLISRKVG